jgi:hypothetical protein
MKHHFVKTRNYEELQAGVRFMEERGSPSSCLCLVHGEPGVGKTRNISKWGADSGAILVKGHVGMTLDGILWAVSQGLGLPKKNNRTELISAQVEALQASGQPIVFDEAQFGLFMRHAGKSAAGIEYLRDIAERGNTFVMLVCHESEVQGFSASAHVRGRIAHRVEMHNAGAQDTTAFIQSLCEVPVTAAACAVVHGQTRGKFRLLENAISAMERLAKFKGLKELDAPDVSGVSLVVDHEQGLGPKLAVPTGKKAAPKAGER